MTTTPAALRKRTLTAARRSLGLILKGAQSHLDQLDAGQTPADTFAASMLRYEDALTTLTALDQLGETGDDAPAGEGWLVTVEVNRDDLDLLIQILRESDLAAAIENAEPGSPVGNLLAALKGED